MTPPKLCSETLVHNPQKEVDISTSADTVIDNDDKFETVLYYLLYYVFMYFNNNLNNFLII